MNTTINISLPRSMLSDVKNVMGKRGFTSISEFFRDAVRHYLYPAVTENGFTPEFEEKVLKAAAESTKNDIRLRTAKDIENYFLHLKFPRRTRRK